MEIVWKDRSVMYQETDECYSQIDGIRNFIEAQNMAYGCACDGICFGDYQIDYVKYNQNERSLTLRFIGHCKEFTYNNKSCTKLFFVFDFWGVDDLDIEIAPEFWISDIFIQKKESRFYWFCDGTNVSFSYDFAKANRWWGE